MVTLRYLSWFIIICIKRFLECTCNCHPTAEEDEMLSSKCIHAPTRSQCYVTCSTFAKLFLVDFLPITSDLSSHTPGGSGVMWMARGLISAPHDLGNRTMCRKTNDTIQKNKTKSTNYAGYFSEYCPSPRKSETLSLENAVMNFDVVITKQNEVYI